MKAIILGATGLLGKALVREWTGDEVHGMGSRDVDIRDSAKVREIVENAGPDWIVLAAAYTDVDGRLVPSLGIRPVRRHHDGWSVLSGRDSPDYMNGLVGSILL